jgi:hypothetical protein
VKDAESASVHVRQAIDREVELVLSAVNLVATGGAPSATIAGLRLTDAVVEIVRPIAIDRGVILEALWSADEDSADVRVYREVPAR